MNPYEPSEIEPKWQQKWRDSAAHATPTDPRVESKQYVLDMYPYPSGSGLHVGHAEGYSGTDIYARYLRATGKDVLHPMGWDAFGLPAENYAIKTGVHPEETTKTAIANFKRQIDALGFSYDWDREIAAIDPAYYKWTQWIFIELFKKGLAYKKYALVNWCPSCQTVLANEQVVEGECERCDSKVEKKNLAQWFFKITDYAQELLDDLEGLDWPRSTVEAQRNWIGRSEGAEVDFKIKDHDEVLRVFTTRPDTLFGATYMVVAPEHALIVTLKESITNYQQVDSYVKKAVSKSDIDRQAEGKEKTGMVLEGVTALNPVSNEEIPVYVADYVLGSYGTGAIMAVPAHDARDFEFAKTYGITIKQVLKLDDFSAEQWKDAYAVKDTTLINSGEFDGMNTLEAKALITQKVAGEQKTTYRLRDWSVGRQRYWGAPIPIVYDPEGNPVPVPVEHLPWTLPRDVEFKPTGYSPLADSEELKKRTVEIFGEGYTPEIDTLDTFVDSSWYFIRYCDPHNTEEIVSKEKAQAWLPVDMYVGGAEHTVLHLLYSRFITKFLRDLGVIEVDEPFKALRHQGMILGPDSQKMSKSKGNVINPDEMIERFGADTMRMYEMFMGPFDQMKPWSIDNMVGVRRFIEKLWRLVNENIDSGESVSSEVFVRALEKTIKKVGEDTASFNFNTAVSALMIIVNEGLAEEAVAKEELKKLLIITAPYAPHATEELWEKLGETTSVHQAKWPEVREEYLTVDTVTLAIQVNGKVRANIEVSPTASEEEVLEQAKAQPEVQSRIEGRELIKTIYVPGRICNLVVKE